MLNATYDYRKFSQPQVLCGFRKAHSASHFQNFTKMSKTVWHSEVYWYNFNGLVKSLWLLTSWFINSKLEAYGFGNGSLNFLLDYLPFRKQRTKVSFAYSNWSKIRRGIPQGSILGLNLFSIFIDDIFMIIEQSAICNFADDNTLYSW